jgi:tetratricopeptide (TPR) repeat protein
MEFAHALHLLEQVKDDPQALTVATAQVVCARLHPDLFAVLEAAAIPHWFDRDILAALLQTDAAAAAPWLERLRLVPLVESYAARKGWNVHEATRLALRAALAQTQPERYAQLSRQAAAYFSDGEERSRIEQIYHRLAAAEPEAERHLRDLHLEWRDAGRYEALQALALVLEELRRGDSLRGTALARTLVILFEIRRGAMPSALAHEFAQQAVTLFAQAGDEPGEADARQVLGMAWETQGRLAEALREYRAYRDITRRLCEREPDNADWQRGLSVSYNDVGRILESQNQRAEALLEFRACMEIAWRLCQRDPGNLGWQRDLSVSHNRAGRVLQAQGQLGEALREYWAGMEIRRRLCERDPDNADWQRDLSISHYRIASLLETQGQLPEALAEREANLKLIENLAQRDPDNEQWQRDLDASRNALEALKQRMSVAPQP